MSEAPGDKSDEDNRNIITVTIKSKHLLSVVGSVGKPVTNTVILLQGWGGCCDIHFGWGMRGGKDQWPSWGCVSGRSEFRPMFSATHHSGPSLGTSSKVPGLWGLRCHENMRWWLRAPAGMRPGSDGTQRHWLKLLWGVREDCGSWRVSRIYQKEEEVGGRWGDSSWWMGHTEGWSRATERTNDVQGVRRRPLGIMKLASVGSLQGLHCLMWNLPGPGTKLVSSVLAGIFLTTGPPGKCRNFIF